jgi:glycosyltransferase involved in cell wall biosynthesis
MPQESLVSIIINNYNYAQYLGAAIDSALCQSYPDVEVLVVDDGSTDNSRDVILRYGHAVTPVLKSNGGQASAFNAGFAKSRGAVVIFLDADDLLLPDTARAVMHAFHRDKRIAKVQYRLEIVDARGTPTGAFTPPAHVQMPSGDLRRCVLRFPDDIPYPPTSGNAFASWALRRILPVPEATYGQVLADIYLYSLVALLGPVVSLDAVGGHYRVHGDNRHHVSATDVGRTRQIVEKTRANHRHILEFARALHLLDGSPREPALLSVTFVAHRILSLKLDPARHPIQGDTLLGLLGLGLKAATGREDVSVARRLLYAVWFVAFALAPASLARRLAARLA